MMVNNSFIRYGLIGVVNTTIGYGLIFLLFYLDIIPEVANFIGYLVGIFVSYFLNRKFNFKNNDSHKKNLPKFIIAMVVAYLISLAFLSISYRMLVVNLYLSQIFSGIVYVIVGFQLSKVWVFKER